MSDREDRQDYRIDSEDLTGEEFHRRAPRRRPAMEEPGSGTVRQERRRRAEMELEQVEQAYMEKRSQAAQGRSAYPAYEEPVPPPRDQYPSPPGQEEFVPGYPPSYPQPPVQPEPEQIVPAYPKTGRKKSVSGRMQTRAQFQDSPGMEPQPDYPVSDQGNEVLIDASQNMSRPAPRVLPKAKEYGGQSDILGDDDLAADEAASLAKGGRLQARISTNRRKKRVGKRRYGVFAGSVVLLFAVVGIVVVCLSVFNVIHGIITDDSALRAYDELIGPVVGMDPQPFENIKGADPEMVLLASILAVEYESADSGLSEYDDYEKNVRNIPVSAVLNQATRLFGPDCNVRLQSIEDEIYSYEYKENEQIIVAPLFGSIGAYIAKTESSRRSGDSVLLRVGYVSVANMGETTPDGNGGEPEEEIPVDKYREYEMRTDPQTGQQYVFAVRDLEGGTGTPSEDELL